MHQNCFLTLKQHEFVTKKSVLNHQKLLLPSIQGRTKGVLQMHRPLVVKNQCSVSTWQLLCGSSAGLWLRQLLKRGRSLNK